MRRCRATVGDTPYEQTYRADEPKGKIKNDYDTPIECGRHNGRVLVSQSTIPHTDKLPEAEDPKQDNKRL